MAHFVIRSGYATHHQFNLICGSIVAIQPSLLDTFKGEILKKKGS